MLNNPTVTRAVETMEGDKVIVKRLFPVAGLRNQDPFVLWDHFEVAAGSGFPAHPHRGFEAITYLFSGEMAHEDNLGNSSIIGPGGAQRFTAGKGIVHSEMPGGEEPARGLQLWINLPKRLKHIDPDYQDASADEIAKREVLDGNGRKVIIRSIVGEDGPIKLQTSVVYYELIMDAGSSYQWTPPKSYSGLIYVVKGIANINEVQLKPGDSLRIEKTTEHPDALTFSCEEDSTIMVCFGKPHGEPILQRGTFVD